MSTNSTPAKIGGSFTRHAITGGGIAGIINAQDDIVQLVSLIVTVIGLAWSIWEKIHRPQDGIPASRLLIATALLPALLLGSGCSLVQRRTLDPAGAYQSNTLLWQADSVIIELADLADQVTAMADRNPEFVASRPDVAAFVDRLRREQDGTPSQDEVLTNLIQARDRYAASPTAADDLRTSLNAARALLNQARLIIPVLTKNSGN